MPNVTINLTDEQFAALRKIADKLGVDVNEAARRGLVEYLMRIQFEEAAAYVLKKNEELYRRLAK